MCYRVDFIDTAYKLTNLLTNFFIFKRRAIPKTTKVSLQIGNLLWYRFFPSGKSLILWVLPWYRTVQN